MRSGLDRQLLSGFQRGRKLTAGMGENIDTIEELLLSLNDAPGTRRTVFHFEHKNDVIVNLIFPYWKLLFLIPVFNYL